MPFRIVDRRLWIVGNRLHNPHSTFRIMPAGGVRPPSSATWIASHACRSGWLRCRHAPAWSGRSASLRPLPAGAWRNCAATSPHTTHRLSPQKIHYRHHPFQGSEVEVVRALRRSGEEVLVVKVPQGYQIAVPGWMLDAMYCSRLPQEARPRVALAALLELATLLDTQRLPSAACAPQSGPSSQKGVTDAPRTKDRLSASQPGLPQEGPVGKVPRTQSSSLPRTDRAVVASRRVNPTSSREEP